MSCFPVHSDWSELWTHIPSSSNEMHSHNLIGTSGAADRMGHKPGDAYWLLQNQREEKREDIESWWHHLGYWSQPYLKPYFCTFGLSCHSVSGNWKCSDKWPLFHAHPLSCLSLLWQFPFPFEIQCKYYFLREALLNISPNVRIDSLVFCKSLLCTNHTVV